MHTYILAYKKLPHWTDKKACKVVFVSTWHSPHAAFTMAQDNIEHYYMSDKSLSYLGLSAMAK